MSGSERRRLLSAAFPAALAACVGGFAAAPPPHAASCNAGPADAQTAVEWYRPADAGDRRTLDAWCAAVGPVVVDTVPDRNAWTGEGDTLRILGWNVSAGGGDLVRFLGDVAQVPCDGSPAPAPPFVLLAQEAFRRSADVPPAAPGLMIAAPAAEVTRPGPRDDVVTVARRCGLALFYVPAVRNGGAEYPDGREDRGNAVLANVPLHDLVAVELPAEDSRRLAIGVTVRPPGGDSLRLVTFHFTLLPKLWRNLVTGNAARLRHALGLLDALGRIEAARGLADGIATVSAGDANTWSRNDAALRRLRKAFPDSPPPLAEPTRGSFPADHLLFRVGVAGDAGTLVPGSYVRLGSAYSSDHYPLAARYAFPP